METIFENIIKWVLQKRKFVLLTSLALFLFWVYQTITSSVDILPDLNRPTVTVFTEAEWFAAEEVELLVTTPIESVLNGASWVERVRSISSAGLSLIFVEFDWNEDIYLARQIVSEKLNTANTPEGTNSVLGPISSIMWEIQLIGLSSPNGSVSSWELRALADWSIRPKLLTLSGIAQVTVIWGQREEYQILLDPNKLANTWVALDEIIWKLEWIVENKSGNFLVTENGESPIRIIAQTNDLDTIKQTIIAQNNGVFTKLGDIAEVSKSAAINPRWDAGINGNPGVIMSIQKQPDQNTLELGERVKSTLDELQLTLWDDVTLHNDLFTQEKFIRNGINNISTAIRDASILVVIILILFLWNWRALVITLTALPLSFIMSILILRWFGIELNVMTLWGLAVAIWELTDDAVVDLENSIRWLKANAQKKDNDPTKKTLKEVILGASREVRGSVVYSTILVTLVFLPLLALGWIEWRLMAPLAIAYITALVSSTIVAMTIMVILRYYLLPHKSILKNTKPTFTVKWLHNLALPAIKWSLNFPKWWVMLAIWGIVLTSLLVVTSWKEFLPPFNEWTLTIWVSLPPGSSLSQSNTVWTTIEKALVWISDVTSVARRSGRAEEDEHANGVQISELEVDINADANKNDVIQEIKDVFGHIDVQGANVTIGQPISHRIEHILSWVRAPLVIKVFGNDLDTLRSLAEQIQSELAKIPGTLAPVVQQEVKVPELSIIPNRQKLSQFGMRVWEFTDTTETLLAGHDLGTILEGNRSYELTLRLPPESIQNKRDISYLPIANVDGKLVSLWEVAEVKETLGRNTISHDNGQRRMVVSSGILDGDSVTIIETLKKRIAENIQMPKWYFVSYEGTYKSQKESSRKLIIFSILAFIGIVVALFIKFRSMSLVLQVLANIPVTFLWGMIAIKLTGNVINLASMVWLISLLGLAARNGILLIEHWKYLIEKEGMPFNKQTIITGSLNRLTPMLMTSLTSMLALLPLIIWWESPGKEILYPLATVVFGWLLVSTLVEVFIRPGMFLMFYKNEKK